VADVLVDGVSVGAVTTYTFSNVTTNHTIAVSFLPYTRTIHASTGDNGAISPAGLVTVNYGGDQTFSITPATNYHVVNVWVDNVSVGPVTSYTFTNVTADHNIYVSFAIDTFTITASAGANGDISPAGSLAQNYGASQTFTITPNIGYHVADVLVDDVSVGPVTSYTFNDINANHTIAASFAINPRTITATAGANGAISPAGAVSVNSGGSQTFTIAPEANYNVLTVLVDGVSVGPVSSYTFDNVTADHTITASFVAQIIAILTDRTQVRVPPGKMAAVQVKLSGAPPANVTVTSTWLSGSSALSISGVASLTFTPTNWNTYQTVQIAATPDQNDMNATAVFDLSGPGLTEKQVTAVKGQTGRISTIFSLLVD